MASQTKIPSFYNGWLPSTKAVHKAFLKKLHGVAHGPHRARASHNPAVEKFAEAIKSSPIMVELFDNIFLQQAQIPELEHQPENLDMLLYMIDPIVISPPMFLTSVEDAGQPVGVPLYLLFDLLSNTSAGYDLFRMPAFNVALKELLDSWGAYLQTEDSNKTLNEGPDGWFSKAAITALEDLRGDFNSTYVVPNPNAENRGYMSWDAFFCRQVLKAARPVDAPDNQALIHNACESTVYNIARNVKLHDQFWLKTQAYSLYDMLNGAADNGKLAEQFVGGTVYQAFLSPVDYHRWHTPIDGTIEKIEVLPGTYYAALPDEGDPSLGDRAPSGALIRSQAWLTMSAARALFYIRAANPKIGLVCFIAVGMAEVSTCFVTSTVGKAVKTGDELGMFRFGGSSHALIFQEQANVQFFDNVVTDQHLKVNSIIAHV
ncbi:phosphatidylserine decarboxylase [Schizopora paradoxa]|uniref:Phosphatidylserine decarboxylase n=1 Tax=Schizopora paradoxa TaxID=27342 RepID=A0A0H2RSY8_9AGAM|nr:phosphatidylserine decarboxylase [Schizopora paradoxa]